MAIEVVTGAVVGAGDAVRMAADRLNVLHVPSPGRGCGDVAADDAVRALLDVVGESVDDLVRVLRATAMVIDVAAVDYARAEAHLAGHVETGG